MKKHSMRVVSAHVDGLDHDALQTDSSYVFSDLMTADDRRLLLNSWHRLAPYADRLATVFFDRLFELTPTRRLFAGSTLESQFLQFAYMLVELVAFHDEPHTRLLASEEIRRCLSRYGIADAHYLAVSQAVSAVLTHAPEACATSEARAAWHEAYDLLTAIVRRAANRRVTAEWLARAS
jgi:hemoglobin-like flavoprotein